MIKINGKWKHTEEEKKKEKKNHWSKKLNAYKIKEKIGQAHKGRTYSLKRYPNFGMRGKKHIEKAKQQISMAKKGYFYPADKYPNHGMRGKKQSEEARLKIKQGNEGKKAWNKGIPCSEETKKILSLTFKGRIFSKRWKKKISLAKKKQWLDIIYREKHLGINNGNWCGGTSKEPYSLEWRDSLKRKIRERDNYMCQLCFTKENKRRFCIHHIDYNKKNCNENNLITLCDICHNKTKSLKNKVFYKSKFQSMINEIYSIPIPNASSPKTNFNN